MAGGGTTRRALTLLVTRSVALVAVLAMAGCAAIPTQGPIRDGDVVVPEPGPVFQVADDPLPDGSPEEIVNGFLNAGAAGLSDEFVVARKYLTSAANAEWDPTARVLVYPLNGGGPVIDARDDGSVVVSVPVEGSLDAAGIYTEAPPEAHEELGLQLERDSAGQWRIASLGDVVLLSASSFANSYRRTPLYFASLDGTQLVPDVRWFPSTRIASYAVKALLAGPSAWLRDVVVSGAPDGTRMSASAVTVSSDQVATVSLNAAASSADEQQRNLLLAQLRATFDRLPGSAVSQVEITVGSGLPWVSTATDTPERDVQPETGPYVLADGNLATVTDGQVVPVEDAAPLVDRAVHDPAVSLDGSERVVLEGAARLLLLPADAAAPVLLATGTQLVAPTIDRFGWVWTGERAQAGVLTAVLPTGETVTVAADWLQGRTLRSMRVSRDGSRIAVVHSGSSDQAVVVDVAAVVRDETGRPQRLGEERFQVGAVLHDATQVAWVDEGVLAVLGTSGTLAVPTMHLVPVGGPTDALPMVDGTVAIAAGRGDRALYLADVDGGLVSRQGASWVAVAADVSDPVFPG